MRSIGEGEAFLLAHAEWEKTLPGTGTHILVIDDDESVRDSLKVLLSVHGYEVALAPDGREGLAALRRKRFDLVVTDLLMPNVDGIETIREIRKHDASLKILAMSGGDSATQFLHLPAAKALGADEILKKPFDEDSLLAAIRRLTFL